MAIRRWIRSDIPIVGDLLGSDADEVEDLADLYDTLNVDGFVFTIGEKIHGAAIAIRDGFISEVVHIVFTTAVPGICRQLIEALKSVEHDQTLELWMDATADREPFLRNNGFKEVASISVAGMKKVLMRHGWRARTPEDLEYRISGR